MLEENNQINAKKKNIYLYDFNGNLAGSFHGPTEAAKKMLGYNSTNATIYDSNKLSSLRYKISNCAKSNANSNAGISFVQGYAPSYRKLESSDVVNNRRNQGTRGNRVLQYDFDGNLVHVFKNASEAAESLGKSTAWVSILCNADSILRYDK